MKEYRVLSDQATLAAYELGSGSPLLLVHGTSNDATRWFPLMDSLSRDFRIIAYDRRGRGSSIERGPYAFAQEVGDVMAMVEAIGEPLTVLGHSFGALCLLAAIPSLAPGSRAILYEPPTSGRPQSTPPVVAHLVELIEQGRRDEAIQALFVDHLEVPPAVVEVMRSKPGWQNKVAAAHTVPRELAAAAAFEVMEDRYNTIELPVMLIEGSLSPALARAGVAYAARLLPHSETVTMYGQKHLAMDTAPEQFARLVRNFVLGPYGSDPAAEQEEMYDREK